MAKFDEVIKGYHRDIENLQDTIDSKNVELRLLESNLQESIASQVIASSVTCTIAEMIGELLEFEKLKGANEKTKFSKNRLIQLMLDTEKLNTLSAKVANLKLINKDLHSAYQRLRIENMNLTQQIKNTQDAEQY